MARKKDLERRPIGIHVSIAGNIDLSVDRAIEIGCLGAFQIFTCSPRRWNAKPIQEKEADAFREKTELKDLLPFAHMPYMPNLASPDNSFHSQSIDVLTREIMRCSELRIQYLVLHFGSFLGSSLDEGRRRVVQACRLAIGKTKKSDVRLLLENSASGRNSMGSKFEAINEVLQDIGDTSRTGVCLDTCHAFAAGYEMRTMAGVRNTMEKLDSDLGLEKLFLIHANDSQAGLGECRDRHEHIGLGKIGLEGFKALLRQELVSKVPVVLETPVDERRNEREDLAIMKRLANS